MNDELVTIGLVGYPNVGKSSTINTLLVNKKVSVSSTPGKTKHFQVSYLKHNSLSHYIIKYPLTNIYESWHILFLY